MTAAEQAILDEDRAREMAVIADARAEQVKEFAKPFEQRPVNRLLTEEQVRAQRFAEFLEDYESGCL